MMLMAGMVMVVLVAGMVMFVARTKPGEKCHRGLVRSQDPKDIQRRGRG